jgi:hypothetical protein
MSWVNYGDDEMMTIIAPLTTYSAISLILIKNQYDLIDIINNTIDHIGVNAYSSFNSTAYRNGLLLLLH